MATAKRNFKSKRRLVGGGGNRVYRSWKDWSADDYVIGEYVGDHKDQYKNTCPIIKVVEVSFEGVDEDDFLEKELVLNSSGFIDFAFYNSEEPPETGELVKITYEGMGEVTKGTHKGKEMHTGCVELMGDADGDDEESEDEESGYDL